MYSIIQYNFNMKKKNIQLRVSETEKEGFQAAADLSGDEVTITTEPYMLHGGVWQDAITESGKTITVITPEQENKNLATARKALRDQQDAFSRLHALSAK